MNKKILHLVCGCLGLLMTLPFISCSQEENLETPSGLRIALKEFQQDVNTRAIPAELEKPLANKFDLKVKESASGRLVHEGKVDGKLIPLSTGTYTVAAVYGKKDMLAIDAPAYEGSTSVTLKTNEEKTVNMTCKVANALLSVKITNPAILEEKYSEYKVGVRVHTNSIKISDFKKSIYFPAGTAFNIFFEGRQKSDGSLVNNDLTHESIPTTCKAGDHVILTMTMSNVAPDISKVEVRQEEISATIPVEWLPRPRIQSEAGFVENAVSFAETETQEARLKLITASPLQDIKLKFNFEDKALSTYNATEYVLSNSEHRSQLESLGLILPEIGASASTIDFKPLTAKLQTNAGVTTTNTVKVDVKANNRWSSENNEANRTYTFNCSKPVFTFSIVNSSVWTKQFSFNAFGPSNVTAGSPDKLNQKMVYQVKEQGQESWQTVEAKDLVCGGLHPNTTYQARALYRGEIASNEVTVTTYPEIKLPNGDMESWNFTSTKEGKLLTWVDVFRYYPFNPDDQDPWWATNMERAVIWSVLPIELTTCPNVSYVTDAHSGEKAAEIRTSGHGGGYATTGAITYPDAAFAGRLFIGTYAWKDADQQTLGHPYVSRPTALSFWYKYTPFNTDAFKVLVQLKNTSGEVIAEGNFAPHAYSLADEMYKECKIELIYKEVSDYKPASIYVDFASTNAAQINKNEHFEKTSYTYHNNVTRECYIGSRLKIDDITLVYEK